MFDDLASRYLDGETSEAEEQAFLDLLKADPFARSEFARLLNQHGALRWQFSEAKPVTARRRRRFPSAARSPLPWIAAGAAAAVLLAIVAAALSRPSAPPSRPQIARPPQDPAPVVVLPPETPMPAPVEIPATPPAPPTPQAPSPLPAPAPEAPKPAPLPPPVVAEAPKPTAVAPAPVARLETVEGANVDGRPARAGDPLLAGQVVEGAARLRWDDGTSIALDGRLALDRPLAFSRGTLEAEVAKQEQPFVISTPHGEARVLGTRFTLRVDEASTRLEVREGKVRLSNGAAAVEVGPGHFAVAAPKTPLASKPLPLEIFRISFGPDDGSAPPEFALDDGGAFDEKRGWGWEGDLRKNTRNRQKGSALERRQISGGSAHHTDRWELAVPNGLYLLTISCGDQFAAQGPHRVLAEGAPVVRDVQTKAGQHVLVQRAAIEVKDGRFTLELGALGTPRLDKDASADTILNYLILQRIR